MASKLTVTGVVAGGVTVTALVINNITHFSFDPVNEIIRVTHDGTISEFDISACTTLTFTVTAPNSYSLTIS